MTKEEMNRAKEWAKSYCADYEKPYYSMGKVARCYLHALSEIERLQAELDEQCRLNGMGAQREARLETLWREACRDLEKYRENEF